MKSNFKIGIFYIVLIGVIIFAAATIFTGLPSDELVYSDIRGYFVREEVKSFVIDEDTLKLELRVEGSEDTKSVEYELRDVSFFVAEFTDLINEQYDKGIIEEFDYPPPYEMPFCHRNGQ